MLAVSCRQLLARLHPARCRGIPFYLLMGKRALLSNTQTWPCPNLVTLYWTTVPLIVYANAVLFATRQQVSFQSQLPADVYLFVQSEVLFYDEFERNDIGVAEIVIVPCLAMFTHRSMIALCLCCSVTARYRQGDAGSYSHSQIPDSVGCSNAHSHN